MWANPNHLRGNHYFLRTIQEGLQKSKYWGVSQAAANSRSTSTLQTGATQLFEAVYDATILAWVPRLKERLNRLMRHKARHDNTTAAIMYSNPFGVYDEDFEVPPPKRSWMSNGASKFAEGERARMRAFQQQNPAGVPSHDWHVECDRLSAARQSVANAGEAQGHPRDAESIVHLRDRLAGEKVRNAKLAKVLADTQKEARMQRARAEGLMAEKQRGKR